MVSSASAKKPAQVAWLEAYTVRQRSLGVSVAFGLSCSLGAPRKLKLDIATDVCLFLTPHDGRDKELEVLVALDRDILSPPYMPPISIPDLIAYVARLECLNQQRHAASNGYFYMHLVGKPAQVTDSDHVMHNMMTKVVWGQDPLDAGACIISLERLTAGANALSPPDEVLNRILARGGAKHSHASSLLLTIHPRLKKPHRALGHEWDATVLEAVGRCWRAWKERGLFPLDPAGPWVKERTFACRARVRFLGLLQVSGSNVLPLPKRDIKVRNVFAKVDSVGVELLCAPIGSAHREHVAIMCWCWGPHARNLTKFWWVEIDCEGERSGHSVSTASRKQWLPWKLPA